MIYIGTVEDDHALIEAGPVLENRDAKLLTSHNLDDITDSWEYTLLHTKGNDWPALQLNADQALARIERFQCYRGESNQCKSLLDFGCGWGFFLRVAKSRGWNIHGLEPLPACAVYARATTGGEIVTDTLRDHTFPVGSFDAITSFQVFEHLPDPSGDLAKLHRMLKPGGIILIEVPNVDTWSVSLLRARHRHFVADHLNFFSTDTLSKLLAQAGFQVLMSYHPTRKLTLKYFIEAWGSCYLPGQLSRLMSQTVTALGISRRVVSFNLGDIVAVIACKPLSAVTRGGAPGANVS